MTCPACQREVREAQMIGTQHPLCRKHGTDRRLASRTILLMLGFLLFSACTNAEDQKIEATVKQSLSSLRVGMTRQEVEALIVKTNEGLIPLLKSNPPDEMEGQLIRNMARRASQGQAINISELQPKNRAFLKINFQSPSKTKPQTRSVFVRTCCTVMFRWIRFDLLIEYDDKSQLQSARYLRSAHEDGADRSCEVLLQVPPPSDWHVPYPCHPNIQEF